MGSRGATILVIPDTHVPYHDPKSLAIARRAAQLMKPSHIVFVGDFADCYAISRFPKSPARRKDLQWEITSVNAELKKFEGLSDEVIFCEGNHEWRLERYLTERAPELFGLVGIKDLLEIPRRRWKWIPYNSWHRIGKVNFTHDVGHVGANATRHSLDAMGDNIVFGHTHRGGTVYDGTIDGTHRVALNVGWLGDPKQVDYMHRARTRSWQQGIGWVRQDERGVSWCTFCPIVEGRTCVEGRIIK